MKKIKLCIYALLHSSRHPSLEVFGMTSNNIKIIFEDIDQKIKPWGIMLDAIEYSMVAQLDVITNIGDPKTGVGISSIMENGFAIPDDEFQKLKYKDIILLDDYVLIPDFSTCYGGDIEFTYYTPEDPEFAELKQYVNNTFQAIAEKEDEELEIKTDFTPEQQKLRKQIALDPKAYRKKLALEGISVPEFWK